jgi:iron complex transport system substrate-binding protein
VSFEDVRAVAERLESRPNVISLDPTTFGEVLGDVRTVALAAEVPESGEALLQTLADRVDEVQVSLGHVGTDEGPPRVNVAALEWLDPPFIGGHWVPQMIEMAGGADFLGLPGERSRELEWDEVAAAEPEAIVLMQCGYDTAKSAEEAQDYAEQLRAIGARGIYACDASAYFSRPGPRLVDGLELLAHTLHPDLIPEPDVGRMLEVELY